MFRCTSSARTYFVYGLLGPMWLCGVCTFPLMQMRMSLRLRPFGHLWLWQLPHGYLHVFHVRLEWKWSSCAQELQWFVERPFRPLLQDRSLKSRCDRTCLCFMGLHWCHVLVFEWDLGLWWVV